MEADAALDSLLTAWIDQTASAAADRSAFASAVQAARAAEPSPKPAPASDPVSARIATFERAQPIARNAARAGPSVIEAIARSPRTTTAPDLALRILDAAAFEASGDLPTAADHLRAAFARAEACDDALRLMIHVALGRILVMQGEELDASLVLFAGVDLAAQLGARLQEAKQLGNLGFLHGESDPQSYEAATRRVLAIGEEIGSDALVIHSLCNLGGALAVQGRLSEARACYARGQPMAAAADDRNALALFEAGLGGLLCREGLLDAGVAAYTRSAAWFERQGDPFQVARQHLFMAEHLARAGRDAEAWPRLRTCLSACAAQPLLNVEWQAHALEATLRERAGELALALSALRRSNAVHHRLLSARAAERSRLLELHGAVHTARLRARELEITAHTDALTGLPNRRAFTAQLVAATGVDGKADRALALAILDLDHFKGINDQHGHGAGDDALIGFARCLRRAFRTSDTLGRWGGEEFCLLFADTDLPTARRALARLEADLRTTPIDTRAGPLTLTFSGGLTAVYPGEPLDTLFARADQALYAAKAAGRARICTALP